MFFMILRLSLMGLLAVPTLCVITVQSTAFDQRLPLLARQADPGATSCLAWLGLFESCTSATPGFTKLPFSEEASCLCYSSSVWRPTVFDSAFDTCLAYLSTASPAEYSSVGGATLATAACQQVGDVLATGSRDGVTMSASPTITSGPTPTSPTQSANSGACVSFELIQASCELATTSFTNLPFSVEASCLCYSSGTYAPSVFDGYWGACLGFYSTASPAFYSSLGGDDLPKTPCAEVGNVTGEPISSVQISTSLTVTSPTITSSSTTQVNPNTLTTVISITRTSGIAPALRVDYFASLIVVGASFFIHLISPVLSTYYFPMALVSGWALRLRVEMVCRHRVRTCSDMRA